MAIFGELVQHRVRDGVLLRLIGKWLNAGVMEAGQISYPETGSPQGGVICPMLANVYLHYVLDEWFDGEVQPRLAGKAYLIRYADDFVIGFTDESDAHRVMDVLPKRFGKYGLKLHPTKTRLVRFDKPDDRDGSSGKPESFDLLGFTHYWGRSRRGELGGEAQDIGQSAEPGIANHQPMVSRDRHEPLAEQQRTLSQKITRALRYYGITGNSALLSAFRWTVRSWRYWLSRRNRERGMTWDRFNQLLERYPLPAAVAIHSTRRRTANP